MDNPGDYEESTQLAPAVAEAPTTAIPVPRSRNLVLIAAAIAVIAVLAAVLLFMFTRDAEPAVVAVDEVSPCDVAPLLTPERIRYSDRGLTITTHITPGCPGGDLLTNHGYRINAVDAAGNDVASGVFDLTQAPIAMGSGGTTVDFVFPSDSYFRTADAIHGDIKLIPHRDSYDTTPDTGMSSPTEVTAGGPGQPETGSIDAAAASALADIAAADRPVLDDTLLDRWQPQLTSKRPGIVADGITWTDPEILREHLQLRQEHPGARLVWSGDWRVYHDPNWWITVAGVPFTTADQALAWCDENRDDGRCFAKMLSHTRGSDVTTVIARR